jgi:hypothetical protein
MTNELSKLHWVNVLVPAADRYNGDPATDIVDVQGEGTLFLLQCGASLTGTATVTAEGCDDTTPTTNTDVPFIYRAMTTSPDTWGAWTVGVSGTGFTTTASVDDLAYQIFVDAADLGALLTIYRSSRRSGNRWRNGGGV